MGLIRSSNRKTRNMKQALSSPRRTLAALIALNIALLLGLTATLLVQPQQAQAQGGFGGGNYTMIAGQSNGRQNQSVIYVMDMASGRMVGLFFNSANGSFMPLGSRDVGRDMETAASNSR